ncbi:MAG: T9SS type A sorting domain-containing protein [Bacteroidota bacterium]|nr:T9SS type A sorting domain-containing protein [Bacteroidota bacterium]
MFHTTTAQTEWKDRYVTLASGDQSKPVVAFPANDQYTVIVWEDFRDGEADIYAQKIDNVTGLALWDPIDGVPVCTEIGTQRNPHAAYDSLGGVIIVWEDYRDRHNSAILDSTVMDIYAHRLYLGNGGYDLNWSTISNGVPVCVRTGAKAQGPRIAGTTDGAYVTWTDYRNSAGYPGHGNRDVYVQYLLSATGSHPAGSYWAANGINVTIPNPCPSRADSCNQQNPDITLDYSIRTPRQRYGAVIAYEDDRDDAWQIFADNIGADGSNLWGNDLQIAPNTGGANNGGNQFDPRIATTGSPGNPYLGAVVAWRDERNGATSKSDIFAQRVTHVGVPLWTVTELPVCTAIEEQRRQRIAVQGYRAMIVWEDLRDSVTTDIDVYGNAIDVRYGLPTWPAVSAGLLSDAMHAQRAPEVDIRSQILVAWEDWREATVAEIYGHALWINDPTQYRWPGTGQPITRAKHDQTLPRVAGDVVVWQDARRAPVTAQQPDQRTDDNIYAQRLGDECDLPTEMHWKEEFVKWTWGTDITQYRFVIDSLGSSYAVWIEHRPGDGGSESVYAQKLDRDGVPKWFNNGVMVSQPGVHCSEPDVCIDGDEGCFVTWLQDGQQIMMAHVDLLGTVVVEVPESPPGNGPRLVEDDGGGAILGYNSSAGIELRHYDAQFNPLATQTESTFPGPYLDVKLSKSRSGGVWFVWHNGTDNVFGSGWDGSGSLPLQSGSLSDAFGTSSFSSITGEIDIDTDLTPYEGGNWHTDPLWLYDGVVAAVVNVDGAADDIIVARLFNPFSAWVRFGGGKNISDNQFARSNPAGLDQAAAQPAIAADSMATLLVGGALAIEQLGGAIVAWTNQYTDAASGQRYSCVYTERVAWTPSSNDYTANVHFGWDQEPPLDHTLTVAPTPDIATVFNPDVDYQVYTPPLPPNTPRYGIVTWTSDRSLGCTGPYAVRAQHLDYTIPNTPPASQPKHWGTLGHDVAPLSASLFQSSPTVKTPWPGSAVSSPHSIPAMWIDDRSGNHCIVQTRVFEENHWIHWNKEAPPHRDEPGARPLSFVHAYPHPVSLSRHRSVSVSFEAAETGTVRITLFDALGRQVLQPRALRSTQGVNSVVLDLLGPAGLVPGMYFCAIEGAGVTITRPLVFVR